MPIQLTEEENIYFWSVYIFLPEKAKEKNRLYEKLQRYYDSNKIHT